MLPRQKTQLTAAYYAAFVAMGISMASLGPTLPALAENTRSSLSAISVLFTARSLGSFVGSLWGGRIYDHLNGSRIMALMIVAIAVLTAITPVVPLLWLLSAVLFLTGAAQGVLNIGGNTQLVWLHDSRVGPFMNGLHFCYGVGTFLAPVIVAQFILRQNGLLWTYLLLAILILPTALVALLPAPVSPAAAQAAGSKKIDPLLITLVALVFGLYSGAALAYGGWIYTYALEMNLTNQTNAAYLTSLFWGALTLGRLVAIPLAMRVKPYPMLLADFAGAFVCLLILALWPTSLAAVLIATAGLGFALASIYPTTMSLSGQMMTITGKVTGFFSLGNSAGSMLLPWVIGQFFESIGPRVLPVFLLVDILLAFGVLAALSRRMQLRLAPQRSAD